MVLVDQVINILSLTFLEIILGIDNLVFISIVTERLPSALKKKARFGGLTLALVARIFLLWALLWMTGHSDPLFHYYRDFSMRDLVFILGGAFLLWKSFFEIFSEIKKKNPLKKIPSSQYFFLVLLQIVLLDLVFSLDSAMTAVAMTRELGVMIFAIGVAILVMMFASEYVGRMIERYPSIKMLALGFLILVGLMLLIEGFGWHFPKSYIYLTIAFSLTLEVLNILASRARAP